MKKIFLTILFLSTAVCLQAQWIFFHPETPQASKYPVLTEMIYQLKTYYKTEKSEIDYCEALLDILKDKINLPLEFSKSTAGLKVNFKKYSATIQYPHSPEFEMLLDSIQPDVSAILKKYNLRSRYEEYLSELILAAFRSELIPEEKERIVPREFKPNFKYIVDRNGNLISYRVIYTEKLPVPAGSIITAINDIPVRFLTPGIINELFYTRRDSGVNIHYLKDNDTLTAIFQEKLNGSVENVYIKKFENKVMYIKMMNISSGDGELIKYALKTDSTGIEKIVFDMRGNPGGNIYEAADIASLFLPKDCVIVEFKTRNVSGDKFYSNNPQPVSTKTIILTDSITAGAAELLVLCLRDLPFVTTMGTPTGAYATPKRHFSSMYPEYDLMLSHATAIIRSKYKLGEKPIIPAVYMDPRLSFKAVLGLISKM
jgi:hypothetical protein